MRPIIHGTSRVDARAAYRSDRRRQALRRAETLLIRAGLTAASLLAVGGVLLLVDHLNGP